MTESTPSTVQEAAARRWSLATLLLTIVVACGAVAANRVVDRYGVFGDAHGRQLTTSVQSERVSKYLFARNYIPENFDGLLLGSSITGDWNTAAIQSAHVYNGSLVGGNVSEALLIGSNVFHRRRLGLVIVAIYPFFTADHAMKSAAMRPGEYWSALGSVELLQTYVEDLLIRVGIRRREYDASGWFDFTPPPRAKPVALPQGSISPAVVGVDPVAVRDYAELLVEAHASADHVIGVIPPISDQLGPELFAAYGAYTASMRKLFSPTDSIIDFNAPEYAAFRSDSANFADAVHLSKPGARKLSSLLAARVDHILAAREPVGATR